MRFCDIHSTLFSIKPLFLSGSSDSSSSSSDDSPARSVQSAAISAPSALALSAVDKDEPRKSFGVKVQNLPVRSTGEDLTPFLLCIYHTLSSLDYRLNTMLGFDNNYIC